MKNLTFDNSVFTKIIFTFLLVAGLSGLANGAAFVVTNSGDARDASAGNGVCADSAGRCTLRAAIEEANASTGEDTIEFALPVPETISLTLGQLAIATNISIIGPGARNLTVQRSTAPGTAEFRVFDNGEVGRLSFTSTISGITISNGKLSGTSFAAVGAGIRNSHKLILTDVVIKNNTAYLGGGIFNATGEVYVNNSEISNNSADNGGGANNNGEARMTLVNSTISNNSGAVGAGLFNVREMSLINCTISHNSASSIGGGITTTGNNTQDYGLRLRNTIVALNTDLFNTNIYVSNGFIESLGNNLIGNNRGVETYFPAGNPNAKGDKVGTTASPIDPLLGALANNGGQSNTRALLAGSPAIDSGNNCVTNSSCSSNNSSNPLTTDQRALGFLRRAGINVDIGAFEVNSPVGPDTLFDFDGDGRADLSVFRPSNGNWYVSGSTRGFTFSEFGIATDIPVVADYDGDGKTDIAVFRPSNGNWYITRSATNDYIIVGFGASGDIPTPADYDGDGKSDIAVFRPSNGTWYILTGNGYTVTQFGTNGDVPVAADYDNDGKSDIAVFRPSNGTWYTLTGAGYTVTGFGASGDIPVTADYDGDGKSDIAVFRPSNGNWYILSSLRSDYTIITFGAQGDIPAAADYNGDGKSDIAVFRPANGNWYILSSGGNYTVTQFGAAGDILTPGRPFVRQ